MDVVPTSKAGAHAMIGGGGFAKELGWDDIKLLMTGQESIQCVRDTNSIYANFTIDVLIINIKKVVLRVVAGLFH